MISHWLAFPAGVCIATIVTSVGFGGGILWMPFLLVGLRLEPETAILTSLLIQTVGTASGSIAYLRRKRTDNRLALLLLVIAVPGVLLGAWIAHQLALPHIGLFIGVISLTTALLFVTVKHEYGEEGRDTVDIRAAVRHSWVATLMAVASGMLTINIGEWLIPVLQKKMSLRMSHAVATCVLITFGISVIGALIHFMMSGRPDLEALSWAIPGVLVGGQLGPRLAMRIDERVLKEMFIFVLTLIGIHLIYSSFPG